MTTYPKDLTDSQKEILMRSMADENELANWCATYMEEEDGIDIINTKIDIIAASLSPHPYDEMRRRKYPDIGDQLDDLYHKGVFSDEMVAKLKAVKDANPKD